MHLERITNPVRQEALNWDAVTSAYGRRAVAQRVVGTYRTASAASTVAAERRTAACV